MINILHGKVHGRNITCPHCGTEFDSTLFQFGHHVRCRYRAEVEYPGTDFPGPAMFLQRARAT